jgi:type IV secretory pathway VirB4 component
VFKEAILETTHSYAEGSSAQDWSWTGPDLFYLETTDNDSYLESLNNEVSAISCKEELPSNTLFKD